MPGRLNFLRQPGEPVEPGNASAPYRHDRFAHELVFTTGDDPFPIVGELAAQIRPTTLPGAAAGVPLASFTVDVDGNVVVLSLTSEQTISLPSRWVWDLQQTVDGVITTLLAGNGRTVDDVTREAA